MKSILFTIALLCNIGFTYAQSYQPFPTQAMLWRESSGGYQCGCCSESQYLTLGDTIINSFTYTKLQKSGRRYSEDQVGNCTRNNGYSFYDPIVYYRNDVSAKKVYLKESVSAPDKLWYDFDLNTGDTIRTDIFPFVGNQYYTVGSIDSVKVGISYHKRFAINNCTTGSPNPLHFIEGIGSDYGLFSSIDCSFERRDILNCVSQGSKIIYPAQLTECQMVGFSFPESKSAIKIYPNPGNGLYHIDGIKEQTRYTVFNVLGKVVLVGDLSKSKNSVDLSDLNSGIYLIQLLQNQQIMRTEKLLKE